MRAVVCGPPGCGKTTWVRERRQPLDLVWDFDEVAAVVANCGQELPRSERGTLPFSVVGALGAMRDGFVSYVARTNIQRRSVYVIVADQFKARQVAQVIGADVVDLTVRPK